jgi:ABC-type spermidine/putrescine transport system permease subunit I
VWGLATAGALLAFVAAVVVAVTVDLVGDKSTTTVADEIQKLDQLAVELLHPHP